MRRVLLKMLLWSWTVSVPIMIVGGYLAYRSLERSFAFSVRYAGNAEELKLDAIADYEINQLANRGVAEAKKFLSGQTTALKKISLILPEAERAALHDHLPQSGFNYAQGGLFRDGKLEKVKIKYRGDTFYRWAWDKKSMRLKTGRNRLYEGMRAINLLAPRTPEQLNNYFSYQLAARLGLIAPRNELVRLSINGKDRGVYTLVEQMDEGTIRHAGLMPGDVYRGELIGKDRFGPGAPTDSLFKSAAVWDKVAVNNHFAESSKAPLELLIKLIGDSENPESQARLSEIMDMTAWGNFSAFESLSQSQHSDEIHNWRIYFDPWRSQFVPLVWDTVGWHGVMRGVFVRDEVIVNSLMFALFRNGDFIRARAAALQSFFLTGEDQDFLKFVADTVDRLKPEFDTDPFLHPPHPGLVKNELSRWEGEIGRAFDLLRERYVQKPDESSENIPPIYIERNRLSLALSGKLPAKRIRLNVSQPLDPGSHVILKYTAFDGDREIRLSPSLEREGLSAVVEVGLLPNLRVEESDRAHNKVFGNLIEDPAVYELTVKGLGARAEIISADFQLVDDWLPAQRVTSPLVSKEITTFAAVSVDEPRKPLFWSGEITVDGHQTIDQPLVIEPGTTIRLSSGALLVLKQKLTAEGTAEQPIRFIPEVDNQEPWGAVALQGRGADESTLSHCEMSDGSGVKGELFEYSAMLSIHDVRDVVISDCQFRNSHVVDDMVHTVYTDILFERVQFENALSDALDLDISSAIIKDSSFERSGNDAVDLMTTRAVITDTQFRDNGDKGISVGEASKLYAANNKLTGNVIGVQSKDSSVAVLFNHTFDDNKSALHAYKKNWRYGEGGSIFVGKSVVNGAGVSAEAEKRSQIQIFDSYLETPPKGKRVDVIAVDNTSRSSFEKDLLPPEDLIGLKFRDQLEVLPPILRDRVHASRRGVVIDG